MIHPALIVFGILYLIELPLHIGYVAVDARHLDDPLLLWYRMGTVIDPVKLYVGNAPGPIGTASGAAVLLGVTYLWYTRKISLGVVVGFLCGVTVAAIAIVALPGWLRRRGPAARGAFGAIHVCLRARGRRGNHDPALVWQWTAGGLAGTAADQRRGDHRLARPGPFATAREIGEPAAGTPHDGRRLR
jgi:hypothetical protein